MTANKTPSLLVGVGASAGGLAAVKTLLKSIPADSLMAFIVIQHLDPTHKSLLTQLLEPMTDLRVKEAESDDAIQAGSVYIIPPDSELTVAEGYIQLGSRQASKKARNAIDHTFQSLANQYGRNCAGILLSGTGTDGTEGLRAIAEAGGLSLAQDPATAEYPGMPLNAMEAGVIDHVAAIEDMQELLSQFVGNDCVIERGTKSEYEDGALLARVAATLEQKENFSLQEFRTSTMQRRIARRVSLTGTESPDAYITLLNSSAEERALLKDDLLINVTNFFRDPEAFQSLERSVIETVISGLSENEEVRIWVAGCSTGEEAYSIAVLVFEALEKAERKNPVKIFATDLDESTIGKARRGLFTKNIDQWVPENLLKKHFYLNEDNGQYYIRPQLRQCVSFAIHNLASDPPFGRMHLISCRNVLIYLKKSVQARVIAAFYFALAPSGYLFLGTSESLGEQKKYFKSLSKKWRIFQKINEHGARSLLLTNQTQKKSGAAQVTGPARNVRRDPPTRSQLFEHALLETFLPPAVVVDQEGTILYNRGDWSRFSTIPSGSPTQNIIQLVKSPLRSRLRSALYKAFKSEARVTFSLILPGRDNGNEGHSVKVEVAPLGALADDPHFGIVFRSVTSDSGSSANVMTNDDELCARQNVEQELLETREELHNTIEELETSTEELKAAHEEALSTNEELQSANEELEASAEELRSLNEELSTVNAQLQEKIALLQKANNDVENFFTSTQVPTIFLNPQLEVERFTPAAGQLLKIGNSDIGRQISTFSSALVDDLLVEHCEKVVANFHPLANEKLLPTGRYFVRQVSPYRTADRRVDGVVVVFQDITELKLLSERAASREKQQAVVARLGLLALTSTDQKMLIRQTVNQVCHTLNADFCHVLRFRPEDDNFILEDGVGWHESLVGNAIIPAGLDSQAGYTLAGNEPVIVKNLTEERRFSGPQLLIDHGVTSGISCVINHADPPYGVIAVHTRSEREFTGDDTNFLQAVANLLSSALRMQSSQEKIFERESQFRSMANSIPQLAWMTDATGYIKWYNQRWYDYTGASPEEMEGWGWQKVHHPEHVDRVVKHFKQSLASIQTWEDEFPLRGKDGNYRWFLSRAEPIFNLQGELVHWFGTNTDITEKREQSETFRDNEHKLRLALDTNKIGFFEYYLQHEETYWDAMIKDLWGLEQDETPTQDLFRAGVHPEDLDDVQKAIELAVSPGGTGRYSATYRVVNTKSGEQSWVVATGQAIHSDKAPQKMVGLVVDITDRKNLEDSLKQAVKELQAADQGKNEFLSILGHELRNPLAALSGSVEILDGSLKEHRSVVGVMRHSVTTMARLLDDLLDLNRVSQNRIQLSVKQLELAKVLSDTLAVVDGACRKKNQTLRADLKHGVYVDGDAPRLEQIFSNLILNASRYSPAGECIELTMSTSDNYAEVAIKDNGVGISEDFVERIFEPFFQIKQDKEAASGLGIGLALAKKLVSLHGGELRVESPGENQGSTFAVRLPLSSDKAPSDLEPAQTSASVKSGTRVLVIEDNENILATMPALLEYLGCEVLTAATGQEGVRKTWTFQPDAILVDIGLPDITGHQVAEILRRDGYAGLLIAISGYGHTEVRLQSKEVGFDHHIAKPVTLKEITELLSAPVGA